MKIADCFSAAVAVAEQNCREWIFLGNGDVFHADELHEIAKEFDEKMPLEEEDFLTVTDDGSIGLLFPGCKEPDWFFVSPEWAIVNVLQEDINDYIVPVENGAASGGGTGAPAGASGVAAQAYGSGAVQRNAVNQAKAFCKNCGAPLRPDSRFCENCGAKNAPEFCMNCGAKLEPGAAFCGECGSRV